MSTQYVWRSRNVGHSHYYAWQYGSLFMSSKVRPLTHPDVAHYLAIAESNKRECDAIDALHDKMNARRSTTGIGADRRDKKKFVPPTLHDLAQNNPLLRDMLKQAQK
jgi:hypothetical protein